MKTFPFCLFSPFIVSSLLAASNVEIECDRTLKMPPEVHASILELQKIQTEYDEDFWFNRDFEKVRHALLHLVSDIGKIAKYCETKEHGKEPDTAELINEVLPDVLMHVLQFSNEFEVDLGQKYEERINSNIIKRLNEHVQKANDD